MAAGSSGLAVLLLFDLMVDWCCQLRHLPVPSSSEAAAGSLH